MKKFLLSVALLVALLPVAARSPAKPPLRSGVYLNGSDFEQGKLALESDPKLESHKIKLNEFFDMPCIAVRHHGETHRYQKNEIFGVRDGVGTDYRPPVAPTTKC